MNANNNTYTTTNKNNHHCYQFIITLNIIRGMRVNLVFLLTTASQNESERHFPSDPGIFVLWNVCFIYPLGGSRQEPLAIKGFKGKKNIKNS